MAGKIFKKEEADQLFGKIIESVDIDIVTFNSLLDKTTKAVMFAILNGELCLLGDNREILTPVKNQVTQDQVIKWADKSAVLELLKNGNADFITVETRENHTTVTYGDCTMEDLYPCPPYCP